MSTETLHISIRTRIQSMYPLLDAQCKAAHGRERERKKTINTFELNFDCLLLNITCQTVFFMFIWV